jgi:hypothetical protein
MPRTSRKLPILTIFGSQSKPGEEICIWGQSCFACYSNCTTMHMVARANNSCGCQFAADGPQVIPLGRTLHMSSANRWRYLVLALRMENAHQEVLDSDDSSNSTCCGDETERESWSHSSPIGSRLLARKIENQQELQAQQTFVLPSAPIVACRPKEGKGSGVWM